MPPESCRATKKLQLQKGDDGETVGGPNAEKLDAHIQDGRHLATAFAEQGETSSPEEDGRRRGSVADDRETGGSPHSVCSGGSTGPEHPADEGVQVSLTSTAESRGRGVAPAGIRQAFRA